ncbi:hypothetical protein ACW5R3_13490 [Bizionia sp. KMM 8389]
MILIYSKDIDEFVNDVIDYLNVDFIRFGESDPIKINEIVITESGLTVTVESNFFKATNVEELQGIWFNVGWVSTVVNVYENECFRITNNQTTKIVVQLALKIIAKHYKKLLP